jgi:two-component system chemotaxis response regulator CheB
MAAESTRIIPGSVLVAPDSLHMFIQGDGSVHLDEQPMLQRPAVDITMQTTASVFGSYTTGVLLTGMGRDGAIGMQSIRQAGGYTIAQNEATCSIYGMPRAAVDLDVVDDILAPEGIIQALAKRYSGERDV